MVAVTRPRASIAPTSASRSRSTPIRARSATRRSRPAMTAVRERAQSASIPRSVAVWDPAIRIFHWTLAAAVLTALVSDEVRSLHEAAGYVALALIALRIIWGFIGPRHARFSSFVRPPGIVLGYLGDIATGR